MFTSATCHPSGFGDGSHFAGSQVVTTDATGAASFELQFADDPANGVVTATATASTGDTSEFSNCLGVSTFADTFVDYGEAFAIDGNVGEAMAVEIFYANAGPSPATNARLTVPIPDGANLDQASSSAGFSTDDLGNAIIDLGTVASGQRMSVVLGLVTSRSDSFDLEAGIASNEADPKPLNNFASISVFSANTQPADVSIAINGMVSSEARVEYTYTMTIANNGPGEATGIFVENMLPGDHRIVTLFSDTGSVRYRNGTVTGSIDRLAAGSSAVITVIVGFPEGRTFTTTGTAFAFETDPNEANNTATFETTILPPPPIIDLIGTVSITNPEIFRPYHFVDDLLEISSVAQTSASFDGATGVQMTTIVPSGMEILSMEDESGTSTRNGNVVTTIGEPIERGFFVRVKLMVRPRSAGSFTVTNTTTATETEVAPDNNAGSDTVVIVRDNRFNDLALTGTHPMTANANEEVAFNYSVSNIGESDSTNTTLQITIPDGFTFVSGNGDGSPTHDNGVVVVQLGTLPVAGASTKTFTLTMRASATAGEFTTQAVLFGDQIDVIDGNNQLAQETTVGGESQVGRVIVTRTSGFLTREEITPATAQVSFGPGNVPANVTQAEVDAALASANPGDQVLIKTETVRTTDGQTSVDELEIQTDAVLGVDYSGDPNDVTTWVALTENDVSVNVATTTTVTNLFTDTVTTFILLVPSTGSIIVNQLEPVIVEKEEVTASEEEVRFSPDDIPAIVTQAEVDSALAGANPGDEVLIKSATERVSDGQRNDGDEVSVNTNGAVFGVDYGGDPNDFNTWIALTANDVTVDVSTTTTLSNLFTETTTQYILVVPSEANLTVRPVSDLAINFQNGQIEQQLEVTNSGTGEVGGFRITIDALPADATVSNATGSEGGLSGIDYYYSLAGGASINLVARFFRPSLDTDFTPSYSVAATDGVKPTTASSEPMVITRVVRTASGVVIEWNSTAGATYLVEYSEDIETFTPIFPAITATANRTLFLDSGPPATEQPPEAETVRYYRVRQVTASIVE